MSGLTRVGFVGLGNIGKPMALRLAAAEGLELHVYDVAPEPVAELVAAGATAAVSVADLDADVVCVMVRDDDQVRAVAAALRQAQDSALRQAQDSALRQAQDTALRQAQDTALRQAQGPGSPVLVIHSTVAPSTAIELADAGHVVLDAPVSGGAMGAADGRLALMVGGTDEAFAAAAPVLNALGNKVVHAGPIGAGTKFKLARNLMHFVAFTAATEAQRLAEAAGLDIRELGEVVRHTDAITGGPGAIMYRESTAPLEPDDFWHGVFANVTSLGVKDLGFAIDLAHELGVDVPLAELAIDRLGPGLGLPSTAG